MARSIDGPASEQFAPVRFKGNTSLAKLASAPLSSGLRDKLDSAPSGNCVAWGIPFDIKQVVLLTDEPITLNVEPFKAPWLVFMHNSDGCHEPYNKDGLFTHTRGRGILNEHVADYVIEYQDGTEVRQAIRRRHQIGMVNRAWGDCCFEAVAHHKPYPYPSHLEQPREPSYGVAQQRVCPADLWGWVNWLYAWENPHPRKTIARIKLEPKTGAIVLSAISAGKATEHPLRWQSRQKVVLRLLKGATFDPLLDDDGLLKQVQLDMGQVISACRRPIYPNAQWSKTYDNQLPTISDREILVEYAAHPDAKFHLSWGKTIPVAALKTRDIVPVAPAEQRVTIRVVEKSSRKPVPVKLHIHGEAGEYLPPMDRHRIINPGFFEDFAPEFSFMHQHHATYIPGETVLKLPLGKVYVEVSKGFEIKPVRKVVTITPSTRTVTLQIEKVLPWREKGWVNADTHVHVLSPHTALLEGAGEGVNVTNLLAVQMGEWMVNAGDFDGRSTLSDEDGEHLLRVGTENRQHVLGHISLIGYSGRIINPMSSGGGDEAAIGDPIDVLLTEWARQCRKQGGIVVMPHFPYPRAEYAAAIVHGDIDAVETTSWGALYKGMDPYTIADWYRFLNCGYFVPIVGGTDKMSANTPVGAVRTYARLPEGPFTYDAWLEAIRSGNTFATYGPLVEFAVEGKPAGTRISMSRNGGTVDVTWEAASVTVPMSRMELVVNGEVVEGKAVSPWSASGSWSLKVDRSSWIALLVRGHYPDQPEVIVAHTSPVMLECAGSPFFSEGDAVTILEQLEGCLAFFDTLGTRAQERDRKRMRLVLTSAHREIHNRLHQAGHYHEHTPTTDHPEHH